MFDENFEIYPSEMTEKASITITMVGEKFEICLSELVENGPIIIHIVSSPLFLNKLILNFF